VKPSHPPKYRPGRNPAASASRSTAAWRLAEDHTHPEAESWLDKVRPQRAEARKPLVAVYELLKRDDRFDRGVTTLLRRVRPRSEHGHRPEDPRFGDGACASFRRDGSALEGSRFRARRRDGHDCVSASRTVSLGARS
jgi:hypothetical protein